MKSASMATLTSRFVRNHILPYWKTVIIICTPLVLLPLPLASVGYSTEKVLIE